MSENAFTADRFTGRCRACGDELPETGFHTCNITGILPENTMTTFYEDTVTNSTAWVSWNDQWQTTATVSYTMDTSTMNDTTWTQWTGWNGYVQTDTTWTQWVTYDGTGTISYGAGNNQLSDEDIAAERQRVQDAADLRMAERVEAVKKAKALLHSLLDEKQRASLERQRFFELVSQTGRRMRIKQGFSRNVDELDADGKRTRTLCAHPASADLVDEDHMIAQLLTLKHDEQAFFDRANVS
jgi:hypothetical protein